MPINKIKFRVEGGSIEDIVSKERIFDRFLTRSGYKIDENNGIGEEKTYSGT